MHRRDGQGDPYTVPLDSLKKSGLICSYINGSQSLGMFVL